MTKTEKMIPKMRFKKFMNSDDWEQCKFKELLLNIGTGKSKYIINDIQSLDTPYPILGSRSIIGYDNSYDYTGEFVLTARVGENAGKLYRYSGNAKITDNTVFLQSDSLEFNYYLLLHSDLTKLSFGSGQPLIKASAVKELEVIIPKDDKEKQLVAKFFSSLDNLITLHQRKLEKVQAMKKAYLTEMFPQNGESVPKRRFAGYDDAWEQRKLEDVMNDFIVPMRDKPKSFGGSIPWTRIEDIEGKYINGTNTNQYVTWETIRNMNLKIIPKDSLIVSASATFGVVAIVTRDLITNQTFIGLVPNKGYDLDFLYTFFQSPVIQMKMKQKSAGSTIFYISKDEFKELMGLFPKLEEQKKIGRLFSTIDNLITLHQHKLEKLKNLKKAYLNELFI